MKRTLILTALLALITLSSPTWAAPTAAGSPAADRATYQIDGDLVKLNAGSSVQPVVPGAKQMRVTKLTPNQAVADLDDDGKQDAVVVLTQQEDGGGTFFYLTALVGDGAGGGQATNAVVLGDRVQVTSLTAEDGTVRVTYLTRKPGEPLGTPPTAPVSRSFQIEQGRLLEVHG